MQRLDRNKLRRSVLDAILTLEQRQRGFSLDEPDDHILRLLLNNSKPVAYFSSSGATVAEIRATVDRIAKQIE